MAEYGCFDIRVSFFSFEMVEFLKRKKGGGGGGGEGVGGVVSFFKVNGEILLVGGSLSFFGG